MDVPLPGQRPRRCRALGLRVSEALTDRVIVVHRGRREVLLRFVERDEEDVQILITEIEHTFAFAGHVDLFRSPVAGPL